MALQAVVRLAQGEARLVNWRAAGWMVNQGKFGGKSGGKIEWNSRLMTQDYSQLNNGWLSSFQRRWVHMSYASKQSKRSNMGVDETKDPVEAVNNILYNTPETNGNSNRHLLQALVNDEPGVLSKVSGVLAARGFNIDSLVVSATEVPNLSRMNIVLRGTDGTIEQARRQLEDMVPVWAVLDFRDTDVIERELLLIKVSVKPQKANETSQGELFRFTSTNAIEAHLKRQAVSELTSLFGGKIVDVSLIHCTVELCSESQKIDAFIHMLKPFGIIEASRSGVMAVTKSSIDGSHIVGPEYIPTNHKKTKRNPSDEESSDKNSIDPTQLPPG